MGHGVCVCVCVENKLAIVLVSVKHRSFIHKTSKNNYNGTALHPPLSHTHKLCSVVYASSVHICVMISYVYHCVLIRLRTNWNI